MGVYVCVHKCAHEHVYGCVCDFPKSSSIGLAELNNIWIHWLIEQSLLWDLPMPARAEVFSWVTEDHRWEKTGIPEWSLLSVLGSKLIYLFMSLDFLWLLCSFNKLGFIWVKGKPKIISAHSNLRIEVDVSSLLVTSLRKLFQSHFMKHFYIGLEFLNKKTCRISPQK